ncbi:TonB-dependent receptor [Rapidithrix thailandica]|uniref:TonB-dependent receptor n=1 Tax=Rapidithrix thailandica TaxID=413964 RepID=A0AAW9S766_9BACT
MKHLLPLVFVFAFLSTLHAQQRAVTGRVTSAEDGTPLIGVTVLIKGKSVGAITDLDGKYQINLAPQDEALIFSFVGYLSQEIPVNNRPVINVALEEDIKTLTEVVITGYQTKEKKNITGSIVSVATEKFAEMPLMGVDQALQGQASGVQVVQSSGTPGGGIMVRIRGNSSISGSNRPLFILDGIPIEDGALSSRSFGGQQDNALATLNPNDIQSIEVLKDASAKAMYGSRAANGVVVITTKRGSTDKTKINFRMQAGMIEPVDKLDLLNSTELLDLFQEAVVNQNPENNPEIAGVKGVTDLVNTDWIDAVSRTAYLQEYQLSAQGGSNMTKFYVSGSYRDEEGVIHNNQFTRFTGTATLDHNASEKLRFGLNLSAARTLNKRIKGDNFLDGVYSGALQSLPWFSPYDEGGGLIAPGDVGYAGFPNFNPLAQAIEPRFDTHTTKLVAGIFAEYEPLSNLVFKTKFSIDDNQVQEDQFEPSTTAIGGFLESVGGQGYGIYSTSEFATLMNTTTAAYNYSINKDHQLSFLAGFEMLQRTSRSSNVQGILFPSDDFTYLTSAGLVFSGSSFKVNSGLVSFFSEVNYRLKDKYLFTLNARYDGSSRFGRDKRYGFFPAFSLGWRVSEEPFLQNNRIIEELKLRASFGYTGNERIGNFQFLEAWASSTAYNNLPTVVPVNLANTELQWESTAELNVGFDLSLYQGRLSVTTDVYHMETSKLLFGVTLPLTTGFGSIQGNIGKVTNRGIELGINARVIETPLTWDLNLNVSVNRNKVKEMATDEPIFSGYQTSTNSTHIVTPGQALGTFWGLKFLGVDPATGDAIYDDFNNDGQITEEDGQIIGNAQPDFAGGLTSTFNFKGLDLTVFFQYSYGNQIINFTNSNLLNSGQSIETNQVRKALDRWQKPGDITDVPRYELDNTFNNRFSSRFVEDASYLRLKTLTLGYTLPKGFVDRYKLSNARIYVSASNLFTLSDYSGVDPEVNTFDGSTASQGMDFFTLPPVKMLLVGINIGL